MLGGRRWKDQHARLGPTDRLPLRKGGVEKEKGGAPLGEKKKQENGRQKNGKK